MFGLLRKSILLTVLLIVAVSTYLSGKAATSWEHPLWVLVYPINADGSEVTAHYIAGLQSEDFSAIEAFMQREALRYSVGIDKPVQIFLGPEVHSEPPVTPWGANFLRIAAWSLQLRWWASRVTADHDGPRPDIRLFLRYHDPAGQALMDHSLGLEQGRIGVVNVFASRAQAAPNQFVITHEMLHTLGATDKYSGPDQLPLYPHGYANPQRKPLYPQSRAEIMGGRIPLSADRAAAPNGLKQAGVGPTTAAEIRWLR